MGFSQGAAMCYSLITKYNNARLGLNISGVIAMSGYVPDDEKEILGESSLSIIPFFLSHGLYDDLIPPSALKIVSDLLKRAGAQIFSKEYEIGHGLAEETVSDLHNWLGKLL